MSLIVITGCASIRSDLVDNGTVTIEKLHSPNAYISRVSAYQEENILEISGTVKRRNSSVASGHVDIDILNSNGESLMYASTHYTPKIIRRKGTKESSFRVRMPNNVIDAIVIRVAHHDDNEELSRLFDCGNNAARIGTKRKS